jgi:hypothetical protein
MTSRMMEIVKGCAEQGREDAGKARQLLVDAVEQCGIPRPTTNFADSFIMSSGK